MKRAMLILAAFLLAGCGSVISRNVIEQVDREITLPMVQENPERYRGSKVLWGGIIVSSENLRETTVIEVIQTELSWTDRPTRDDSMGRFLVEARGFLDTAIYKKDKLITVAGTIRGIRTKKIGKMDYDFPVVEPLEMKLSEPVEPIRPYDIPPWWYSYPYGPYYPYGPLQPYPWPPYPWPYGPYYPYYPRP